MPEQPFPIFENPPKSSKIEVHEIDFLSVFCDGSDFLRTPETTERTIVLTDPLKRRAILERVRNKVLSLPDDAVLLIRLDNVRLMPEFAAPLGLTLYYRNQTEGISNGNDLTEERLTRGKPTFLVNPDPGTALVIHQALEAKNEMGLALYTDEVPWRMVYLGTLQNNLRSALDLVQGSETPITTEDLQNGLALSRQNASNRLGLLYQNGLLHRVIDGRGFAYAFLHPYALLYPEAASGLTYFRFFGVNEWQAERFYEAAVAAHDQSHYFKAYSLAQKSLEMWTEMGKPAETALADTVMGRAAVRLSTYYRLKLEDVRNRPKKSVGRSQDMASHYHREAVRHQKKALKHYVRSGDKHAEARTHHTLGLAFAEYGILEKARRHYAKSLAIRRKRRRDTHLTEPQNRENLTFMATTLNNLANLHNYNGIFPLAFDNLRAAVSLLREINDLRAIAQTLLVYATQARLSIRKFESELDPAQVQEQWRRLVVLTAAGEEALQKLNFELPQNAKNDIIADRAAALEAIGPERYEQACQKGQRFTLDEALHYADTLQTESDVV